MDKRSDSKIALEVIMYGSYETWPLFVYLLKDALRALAIENWIKAKDIDEDEADIYRYELPKNQEITTEELQEQCEGKLHWERTAFYDVWAETKLRWNQDPAGLIRLPYLENETPAEAEDRYFRILLFELHPVTSLPVSDCIWDDFGDTKLVVHGTLIL